MYASFGREETQFTPMTKLLIEDILKCLRSYLEACYSNAFLHNQIYARAHMSLKFFSALRRSLSLAASSFKEEKKVLEELDMRRTRGLPEDREDCG